VVDRKYKDKRKLHPRTVHEGPEGEWSNSFTLYLTSALDGVGGQRHPLATLLHIKTRYPLGGWVGPRVGLEGCGKSRPHRDSILGSLI